jgi:glycosyltransferase involved in cell wall biosynthesis
VVINYRGGLAEDFLAAQGASVRRTLRRAAALVVPSGFLREVFARHDMHAMIVPNVVDLETFGPAKRINPRAGNAPYIVVARNLEYLYGNDIAIRAFVALRARFPGATLSIAGSGPELETLRQLAVDLRVAEAVEFTGRLEVAEMAALYRTADVVLNPSRADNTPNSILEALACGVPVVSTRVGGIPFLVEHAKSAWLVEPDAPEEAAAGMARVLQDPELQRTLRESGFVIAHACAWSVVKEQWLALYRRVATDSGIHGPVAGRVH